MDIIFEDESLMVCHKPAGVPTQTKAVGQEDMESLAKKYLVGNGEKPEVYVIHRLDQPVEGLLVFGKTKAAAGFLSKQVQEHSFGKKYYAIVTGQLVKPEGELVDYLAKDVKNNMAKISSKNDKNAKLAKLLYKKIQEKDGKSLLDIELFTGRHHQIRAQLSNMKNPIYGDRKYGGEATGRNLCLCSYYVGFTHPVTKKKLEFSIKPKGEDFLEFDF